jgi:putative restriction endonuclease
MKFWWVSQNQTYTHEFGGGYMWAPKTDKSGKTPTSYRNMTEINKGDIVVSFANTRIMAIGVALGSAYTAIKPRVFEKAGEAWNDEGWKVDVLYAPSLTPIQPRNHMDILAPLLPSKNSPIRSDGSGNQVYLCEIDGLFANALIALTQTQIPDIPILTLGEIPFDPVEQELISNASLAETEKTTLVMARRGQGLFRSRVQTIERTCRITGVSAEKFLVASHIKPWKASENDERLDGNNGLFLSPHVDKLFDGGYITFTSRGHLEVSPQLDLDVLDKWHIDPRENFGRFNKDQEYFLTHHNEVIFKAA